MAVYTEIGDDELKRFIALYDIGAVLSCKGIAEGIENEQTARILADLDGVIGQGWLYAKPMTAQQLMSWLQQRDRAA